MGLLDFLGFGSKKINVKRVENENGENLIYHEDGNIVHFKYFKKDGKIDGKFYSNYLNGVVCDTLSFKNGLLMVNVLNTQFRVVLFEHMKNMMKDT